jgi:hypothetical protein
LLEVILFAKKNKVAAITNGQVHNHLTRYRLDYHQLSHSLEIYNSRLVIAGCNLYNKLHAHTKQMRWSTIQKETEGDPPKRVLLLN